MAYSLQNQPRDKEKARKGKKHQTHVEGPQKITTIWGALILDLIWTWIVAQSTGALVNKDLPSKQNHQK